MGLCELDTKLLFSCEEMLNEYSYGAYGYQKEHYNNKAE